MEKVGDLEIERKDKREKLQRPDLHTHSFIQSLPSYSPPPQVISIRSFPHPLFQKLPHNINCTYIVSKHSFCFRSYKRRKEKKEKLNLTLLPHQHHMMIYKTNNSNLQLFKSSFVLLFHISAQFIHTDLRPQRRVEQCLLQLLRAMFAMFNVTSAIPSLWYTH